LIAKEYLFEDVQSVFPIVTNGDGNCLYRSISTFVTGSEKNWAELKLKAAYFLDQKKEGFQNVFRRMGEKTDEVIHDLMSNKVWGGPAQIIVVASLLNRPIVVYGAHPNIPQNCRIGNCISNHSLSHFSYHPIFSQNPSSPIYIFFTTQSSRSFKDQKRNNHFVPLLALDPSGYQIFGNNPPQTTWN